MHMESRVHWVEVVEEDGGGFVCTWDGGCAYGAMEVDPIASAWKGEGGRSGKRTAGEGAVYGGMRIRPGRGMLLLVFVNI